MNSLVIYDTQFGNTEQVARAIATELAIRGSVRLVSASDATNIDLTSVDLLVIGGPTQGHRARAVLRDWIDKLPAESLKRMSTATFDTRLRWPLFLAGSAARSITKPLVRKGAQLLAPPESFFVSGGEGPLMDGELDRAREWAASIAASVRATASV